jgi:hypothetical protein
VSWSRKSNSSLNSDPGTTGIGLLTNIETSLSLPVKPRDSGRSGASLKFFWRNSKTDLSRISPNASAVASAPVPRVWKYWLPPRLMSLAIRYGFSEAELIDANGSVKLNRGPAVTSASPRSSRVTLL